MRITRLLGVSLLAGLLLAGCGGQSRAGNPEVYKEIERTTDCATLTRYLLGASNDARAAHDPVERRASEDYVTAIYDRLVELDC